jgi:type I restriction enzyme, S subunit
MSKTKQKSMEELLEEALVPEEEQPYQVPENWVWVRLKSINKDKKRNIDPRDYSEEVFELYSVPSYDLGEPEYIKGKEIGSNKQVVKENEILLCKINPRINRVWIVLNNRGEYRQLASTEWIVISENKVIYPKYLLFLLKAPYFRKLITSNVSGVGGSLTRAKPKEVETYPIALPPLNEQKRIAEKVERLFAKLDEAKRLIEEVKESFELRKISIIKRIIDEGKEDAQQRGWKFDAIKDIFEIKGGGTPSKSNESYWNGTIPWVTPKDMKTLYIQETKDYITEEGLNNSSAKMVTKGSIAMVVRSGILQHSLPVAYLMTDCTVNQDLKVFNSGDELVNKYFLWYVKANEKYLLNEYSKAGTTVNSIEFEKFKSHIIPIPPREEIEKKITKIESIINKEHDINMYVDQISQLENLKHAILHKAFRGELGTNDPTDEHAIELLKEVLKSKSK